MDFKKSTVYCDSVDRKIVVCILKEMGLDRKTKELIKQKVCDTTCKVKVQRDIGIYLD